MKIHNAIMSTNDNELYTSYWPFVSEIWAHFGINPILIRLADSVDAPFRHPSQFGQVITIPIVPDIDQAYQAQTARLLAAAIIEGNNYTADIDMFPCNRKVLDAIEAKTPEDGFSFLIGGFYTKPGVRLCAWGNTAHSSVYAKVFQVNGLALTPESFWNKSIIDLLVTITGYPARSGFDEFQFSSLMLNFLKKNKLKLVHIPRPDFSRLHNERYAWHNKSVYTNDAKVPTIEEVNAGRLPWTFQALREGRYWEAHICRDVDKQLTKHVCDIILGRA